MPLDIGEIGVRVNVRDPLEKAGAATAADGGDARAPLPPAQQTELVDACVRLVLQALRRQGAR